MTGKRYLLIAALSAWFAGGVSFAATDGSVWLDQVNQFARDVHMSQNAVATGGAKSQQSAAAFAKEAAAAEDFQKLVSKINTVEEGKTACESLQNFGYRASTSAEKKALQKAVSMLFESLHDSTYRECQSKIATR